MKKMIVIPFISGVEILGYRQLEQEKSITERRLNEAAGEIGRRGGVPDGANANVTEDGKGILFTYEVPDDGVLEVPGEEPSDVRPKDTARD